MSEHTTLIPTRRILLYVNDQPQRDPNIFNWLHSRGTAILYATTTAHAMNLVEKAQVDAVISDLARQEGAIMNGKAGIQLASKIRALRLSVPICIFTNQKDPGVHALAKAEGASFVTESTSELLNWLTKIGI